jgi:hypothetical protein
MSGVLLPQNYWNVFLQEIYRKGSISLLLILGTGLHTISLLSSSFVEEEHQTWYFYTVTWNKISSRFIISLFVEISITEFNRF